ncbi:PleD family two-component system response regulator [Pedobacter nototheniae]|uniref:response regulator n=1 Tax=Pedobacter nototheniae TaxID=2488994 RepID=UPI00292DBA6A|nr:response regulator [Pedobacter nototheniae]
MTQKRILVVEDYQSNADMVAQVLREDGYEVKVLYEDLDFFDIALSYKPDLVIMDIRLPNADGRDLCNLMAEHAELSFIPVILISAILEAQFDDIPSRAIRNFTKPFDINILSKSVSQILSQN